MTGKRTYRGWAVLSVLLFLIGGGYKLHAQETLISRDTVTTTVHFRQGYSILEGDFQDNSSHLENFIRECLEKKQDSMKGRIHVSASASPEGSATNNDRLAKKRAQRIVDYLQPKMEGFDFEIDPKGVDYDYLATLVEASDMPYKDEVLDILRNTPIWVIKNGIVVDGKKRQLENVAGGRAWWYMYDKFFPEMRNAGAEVYCVMELIIEPEPEPEPIPEPEPEQIVIPEPEPEPVLPPVEEKKPWYIAARTNMLFDAAGVPNAGVEIYLGKRWTIGGNWNYSWWKKDGNTHWYEQTYGGDIELRRYFGKKSDIKPFTGHHLGVFGHTMTYDMETGHKGYQAAKWNWGGGVSYGYALPVARRLNIDFSLGLGYMGGEYKEYVPIDKCYVWQATKKRRWVGPTKAEVSLVWLLGRGNVNPDYIRGSKKATDSLSGNSASDSKKARRNAKKEGGEL